MRCASPAGLLDRGDLVEHLAVAAGQERAAVDHHVDLGRRRPRPRSSVSASLTSHAGAAATGTRWRRAATLTPDARAAASTAVATMSGYTQTAATCGHVGALRVGPARLRAQRAHLAGGVGALQRGQVDHRDRQVDGRQLRRLLDRLRVARPAARCSTPTGSTPGSPCRNRRSEVSSRVASASSGGNPVLAGEGAAMRSSLGRRRGLPRRQPGRRPASPRRAAISRRRSRRRSLSRMMSACPACRAVSSIRCSSTHRTDHAVDVVGEPRLVAGTGTGWSRSATPATISSVSLATSA